MRHKAKVIDTGPAGTRIEISRAAHTDSCAHCGMCSHRDGRAAAARIRTRIPATHALHTGECLDVDAQIPGEAAIAAVLFGLPLLGMLAAALGCAAYAPEAQYITVLGALAGLVLGYVAGLALQRLVPALQVRVHSFEKTDATGDIPDAAQSLR